MVLGPVEIKNILPHRFPMLLIDRVTELVPGDRIVARKAISLEAPWYEPVYGTDYSYPSTLLVESLAQAAAILVVSKWRASDDPGGKVPIFGSLSNVTFGRSVVPGDIVEHHVLIDRMLGDSAIFSGISLVEGSQVLAVGQAIVAMRPAELVGSPTGRLIDDKH